MEAPGLAPVLRGPHLQAFDKQIKSLPAAVDPTPQVSLQAYLLQLWSIMTLSYATINYYYYYFLFYRQSVFLVAPLSKRGWYWINCLFPPVTRKSKVTA